MLFLTYTYDWVYVIYLFVPCVCTQRYFHSYEFVCQFYEDKIFCRIRVLIPGSCTHVVPSSNNESTPMCMPLCVGAHYQIDRNLLFKLLGVSIYLMKDYYRRCPLCSCQSMTIYYTYNQPFLDFVHLHLKCRSKTKATHLSPKILDFK